jgi:hypothetical protein
MIDADRHLPAYHGALCTLATLVGRTSSDIALSGIARTFRTCSCSVK